MKNLRKTAILLALGLTIAGGIAFAAAGYVTCSTCSGRGSTACASCHGTGLYNQKTRCAACNGTGKQRCRTCGGSGKVYKSLDY